MNNWLSFSLNPQDLSAANESQADTQPPPSSNVGCYGLTTNGLHEDSYQPYGNLNESQGNEDGFLGISALQLIYTTFSTLFFFLCSTTEQSTRRV
jgi:hypothetical protein